MEGNGRQKTGRERRKRRERKEGNEGTNDRLEETQPLKTYKKCTTRCEAKVKALKRTSRRNIANTLGNIATTRIN